MGRVVLDMVMSLDGFIAGPNGEDGGLHDWYFAPSASSQAVIDELIRDIGAMVMGRRSYEMGAEHDGFVDNAYAVPHFVLSHRAGPRVAEGSPPFTFIAEGIERALAQAQEAAGDKLVCIAGGADIARQYLDAGLIDEVQIHLVPVLLGDGLRLFDRLGARIALERTRVIEADGVTHLRFRVVR